MRSVVVFRLSWWRLVRPRQPAPRPTTSRRRRPRVRTARRRDRPTDPDRRIRARRSRPASRHRLVSGQQDLHAGEDSGARSRDTPRQRRRQRGLHRTVCDGDRKTRFRGGHLLLVRMHGKTRQILRSLSSPWSASASGSRDRPTSPKARSASSGGHAAPSSRSWSRASRGGSVPGGRGACAERYRRVGILPATENNPPNYGGILERARGTEHSGAVMDVEGPAALRRAEGGLQRSRAEDRGRKLLRPGLREPGREGRGLGGRTRSRGRRRAKRRPRSGHRVSLLSGRRPRAAEPADVAARQTEVASFFHRKLD